MKKGIVLNLVWCMILILFLIMSVSAGVYFSQPEATYNMGDIIEVSLDIDPLENSPLKVSILCDGNFAMVFYDSSPEENIYFELPLTSMHISNLTGDCYFSADYGNKAFNSREFKISKKLDVRLAINSFFAYPGEEIFVEGSATRLNGEGINGEAEVTIPILRLVEEINESGNETEELSEEVVDNTEDFSVNSGIYYGSVVDGEFLVSFDLSKDIAAGDYRMDVFVFEEFEGIRTSEGLVMSNLKIFQVLTELEIALNEQSINPGENLIFIPILIDQSGENIYGEVSVVIKNSKLERIHEKIYQSGESIEYNLLKNMSAGYYEIEISSEEMSGIKKFYVNEKAIVSFELINKSVIVTNVGNIPYKKDIQIELNGKPFIKKVNLDLGESQEFKLTGSSGVYDFKISDGENELEQGSIFLTGSAINVEAIKTKGAVAISSPIVWIFFIIILGSGFFFLFRNIFKKKSFAYPFEKFKRKNKSKIADLSLKKVKEEETKHSIKKDETKKIPSKAEQVLVLNGHKNKAVVIVLKIKNKIGKIEKESLEKAVEHVYEKKAGVYEQGDYIFIVFSPLMTKSHKNEVEAAKAAEKILLVLKEHNKKFKDKIDFGIAINSGEVINKVEDKKLKFTALGNFIAVAKRFASSSDKQILVGKKTYEDGISDIKAEKKKIGNGEVYELKSIVNKEKNQKFVKDFLKRMGEDEKKFK